MQPMSTVKHVQTEPSATWTITYGSAGYPIVDVYISVNGKVQKILPKSIDYVDEHTVHVQFTEPRSGFATVII